MGNCSCASEVEAEVIPTSTTELEDCVQPQREPSADAETFAAGSDESTSAGGSCKGFQPMTDDLLPLSGASSRSLLTATSLSPDFNGTWVCSRVEGDWENFLQERGTPWAMRKVAKGLGYGVGKQTQIIVQDGDELEIVNHTATCPPRQDRSFIKADGSEKEVFDPDGLNYMQRTRWDGKVLRSEQVTGEGGQPPVILQRFMQGHEMCTERISARGVVVRRFYRRV